MNVLRNTLVLLMTVLLNDSYSQDFPKYLENYRFIPQIKECYQLYTIEETRATCRRQPGLKNQVFIQRISINHSTSLGITTPTNETLLFKPTLQIGSNRCYKVYDSEQNLSIICQQIYEGHAIGVTTPDNFTIIFYSDLCKTTTNHFERTVYSNFVNNFTLDIDARSCYKVYSQEEVVSPYNCLSRSIKQACVSNVEGCTTLTTKNNEVLILDCLDDDKRKPKQKNCFYLYDSDNQLHTLCQEKLEERCVGVVTPSNLTVLFECFFCSEFNESIYYNRERQKEQRKFVKNYLADEKLGKNLHNAYTNYIVFNENSEEIMFPYWIRKTACFGLTLKTKETILLNCMVRNENQEQPGCFPLITEGNEKESVCTEVLNETCVGLKTPKNVSIALKCYEAGNYRVLADKKFSFFLDIFHSFLSGTYIFQNAYRVHKEDQTNSQSTYHRIHKLEPDCWVIKIESEVVVLYCDEMGSKKNGCFHVIKEDQINSYNNLNSTSQVNEVCVKVLNNDCVGIVTPGNWTLSFDCFSRCTSGTGSKGRHLPNGFYTESESREHQRGDGGVEVNFISDNIPSNVPIRC